jgi:hypothetical protein
MSTRLQMRTALKRRIPRTDIVDADFDKYINDGLLDLCTTRVWLRSLEYQGSAVATTVGGTQYPLETTFFALTFVEDTTNKRVLERFDGGFREFLDAKQNAQNGKPTRFVEFGSNFYILDPPDAIITLVPYGYRRPLLASGDSSTPNIEEEWHYAIELVAAEHVFRDLGDEERAAAASQEFDKWLVKRDTPVRHAARHNNPAKLLRIHGSYINRRTGV